MNKKIFIFAQTVFFIGFLALLASIVYGVAAYDILTEGSIMLEMYWGRFTFIDIYIAFAVFFVWVAFRENSLPKSILWFFAIMLGGSMAICLYMFLAFRNSGSDIKNLLSGSRKMN